MTGESVNKNDIVMSCLRRLGALCLALGIGLCTVQQVQAQGVPVRPAERAVRIAPLSASGQPAATYISHYDTSQVEWSYAMRDEQRLALRLTASVTGTVDSVFFAINGTGQGNPNPVYGTGRLQVFIADTTHLQGQGANAVIVPERRRDSASVPLSALQPDTMNAVSFAGHGVSVEDSTDFIVEFAIEPDTSDSASVQFLLDGGSSDFSDTDYFPARTRLYATVGDSAAYYPFEDLREERERRHHNLVAHVRVTGTETSTEPPVQQHADLELAPNYPDPFRTATTLPFSLERPSRVTLVVYDVLGRRVATLLDRRLPAGTHEAHFAPDDLPAGIYIARLEARGRTQQQLMTRVR